MFPLILALECKPHNGRKSEEIGKLFVGMIWATSSPTNKLLHLYNTRLSKTGVYTNPREIWEIAFIDIHSFFDADARTSYVRQYYGDAIRKRHTVEPRPDSNLSSLVATILSERFSLLRKSS